MDNGLEHSRLCERALHTPAKTDVPGVVKPGNYLNETARNSFHHHHVPEEALPSP